MASQGHQVAGSQLTSEQRRMLTANLRPASDPDHYIRRHRLHDLMNESVRAPVTLIVAPAGSGKTSLLSNWTAELSSCSCWFSLDAADRDGQGLWSGVIGALESVLTSCGREIEPISAQPATVSDAIDLLLFELHSISTSTTILVIDDMHLIDDNDAVSASLTRFFQHLPNWLHLVLTSRRLPNLPIDRLRARGILREIHFAELQFSHREAAQVLTALVPDLDESQTTAIIDRSDGWAAGLTIGALASRQERALDKAMTSIPEADISTRDYVWHEVLSLEAPELIETLMDIAVVDRIDASLADALTGRSEAGELLLQAESRGLFISRVGSDGWFELHSLVRTALTDEMRLTDPSRLTEQHLRAARWYECGKEVVRACEHWLLADRPRECLRLLAATHRDLYDSGQLETIKGLVAAVPVDTAFADPYAMLEYAWCHLLIDRPRFIELVEQVEWWVARWGSDDVLNSRLEMLKAIVSIISGRWTEAGDRALNALDAMGESWWHDPLGQYGWNVVARRIALTEAWDEGSSAVREIELALARNPTRRVVFEGTRALGQALAGRPIDSLRVAAAIRGSARTQQMGIVDTELSLAEALSHREIGDRSGALVELEDLASKPAGSMEYLRLLAVVELVQAQVDGKNIQDAQDLFALANSLVIENSLGVDARNCLARVGTRLELARDNIESARYWSAQVDDSFWGPVSTGRVLLASGYRKEALTDLAAAQARCPRHSVILQLLYARAVNRADAIDIAASAVECATQHGLLQVVVSEGAEVVDLIERTAWKTTSQWMERLRRAAVDGWRNDIMEAGRVPRELLTRREYDVLRFLPSRLSISEIAEELNISVNTLKFHLKVIYRKLGVRSRSDAAQIARYRMAHVSHA
jgi:LuxR family transcriptional regulator, maltose regulon positive regulatory protein